MMRTLAIAVCLLGACSAMEEKRPDPAPLSSGITRVMTLQHADAQEVADIVTDLLDASRRFTATRNRGFCALMTPDFWINAPVHDQREKPRLVADPRTNSIAVTVPPEDVDDLDRVAELIQRLDVDIVRRG